MSKDLTKSLRGRIRGIMEDWETSDFEIQLTHRPTAGAETRSATIPMRRGAPEGGAVEKAAERLDVEPSEVEEAIEALKAGFSGLEAAGEALGKAATAVQEALPDWKKA